MSFHPSLSDIKQVLNEINKFYILIERDSIGEIPETISETLVVEMYRYAVNLKNLLKDRFGLDVSHTDALSLLKDSLISIAEEKSNYIELTHHSWIRK